MCVDLGPQIAGRGRERGRRGVRIEVAISRYPDRSVKRVGGDDRHEPFGFGGGHQLDVEPDAAGAAGAALQLLQLVLARREAKAADRIEDADLLVKLDAVLAKTHHRRRGVELCHKPCRMTGRPAGQLILLQQHDVAPSRLREVIRHAGAGDATAYHHSTRLFHGV